MTDQDGFYNSVPITDDFAHLSTGSPYRPVPDNWFVGLADIVDSTSLIENGHYKTINTVGAAVISAHLNALPNIRFPFIFAGDGAAFATPPEHGETIARTLDAVRRWAKEQFDLDLRTALVAVSDIRAEGQDLLVARYAPTSDIDYAMFAGGGISWAEQQMKRGKFHVADLKNGSMPDLTGLSCRWTPMEAENGSILSIVAAPRAHADPGRIQGLMAKILEFTEKLDHYGHPVVEQGPKFQWPPSGLELEAKAGDKNIPLWRRKLKLYFETLVALFFFKTKFKMGGFDPQHYLKTVKANSDFRKFEDALMMTLDCDAETRDGLTRVLQQAEDEGLIRFGIFEQTHALMTCIVPSVMTDDHIHFIDGASGGYASAAKRIKQLREEV